MIKLIHTSLLLPSKGNYTLEGIIGVFLVFLLTFTTSCNTSKEVGPKTVGYDFYPLAVGDYRIYDVEEINYLITGFDTAVYQLREIITDSIPSIDQTTYLLRRDIRQNALDDWVSDSVWTVTKTSNYLSITENNIPFIKLTFPVKEGKEWDGNSLNSRAEHIYYYEPIDTLLADSLTLNDQIRVVIEDVEENVTGVDLRSEAYVRGIGLVEKNYLTQKKCTSSDCGSDLGEVIAGRALRQTLIEIGNEE
ncbi:hypothetical protein AAOE16_16065 [Ekhidna sp. MALMAid0563]|uniref:hypothetical protein n=1 Tax=Ekhidna sp. MALMAid0563 TaxID=3143937 RepID=UPI0032DF2C08